MYTTSTKVALIARFKSLQRRKHLLRLFSTSIQVSLFISFVNSIADKSEACVMNIITHDKAYSLYARATFVERRSLKYSSEGVAQEEARQKYVDRGWPMIESLPESDFLRPKASFFPGYRKVGDARCWTTPVYPIMDLPSGSVQANSWALRFDHDYPTENPRLHIPHFKCTTIVAPNLGYSYLVCQGTALIKLQNIDRKSVV